MWFPSVTLLLLLSAINSMPQHRTQVLGPQVVRLGGRITCPMPVYRPARVPYMPVVPLPSGRREAAWTYTECLNPLFRPQPEQRRPGGADARVRIFLLDSDRLAVVWTDASGTVRVRVYRVT
jgi:hypothetical protein